MLSSCIDLSTDTHSQPFYSIMIAPQLVLARFGEAKIGLMGKKHDIAHDKGHCSSMLKVL